MRHLLGTTAVAAALLFAAPAFAQQGPYDTNPTPGEKAQTNQLNSNAAANAQGDADTNGSDAAAPVAPNANDADYAAKKADYDRKMEDYNAQRARYEHDSDRYRAERSAYAHHWDVFFGYRGFRDVSGLSSSELIGQPVSARGGARIGRIRAVDADSMDRIARVEVSTGEGRAAWIDADDLRFDPASRAVYTDLTRDQVDDMSHPRLPRY